jgi:hypothetical protein
LAWPILVMAAKYRVYSWTLRNIMAFALNIRDGENS